MAVRLRLRRIGRKKRPFYRVVAADQRAPRNGRFIEVLGFYDPLASPHLTQMNEERLHYWLDKGAQPSDTVRSLLRGSGILFKRHLKSIGTDDEKIVEELKKWELLQGERLKRKEVSRIQAKKDKEAERAKKAEETVAAPPPEPEKPKAIEEVEELQAGQTETGTVKEVDLEVESVTEAGEIPDESESAPAAEKQSAEETQAEAVEAEPAEKMTEEVAADEPIPSAEEQSAEETQAEAVEAEPVEKMTEEVAADEPIPSAEEQSAEETQAEAAKADAPEEETHEKAGDESASAAEEKLTEETQAEVTEAESVKEETDKSPAQEPADEQKTAVKGKKKHAADKSKDDTSAEDDNETESDK